MLLEGHEVVEGIDTSRLQMWIRLMNISPMNAPWSVL
jgi:hypothetical protein